MSNTMHGIKLVYAGGGKRGPGGAIEFNGRNFDIFDIVTGEKLLNVFRVQVDVSATEPARITVTYGAPFEYEGPAELLTESAAD